MSLTHYKEYLLEKEISNQKIEEALQLLTKFTIFLQEQKKSIDDINYNDFYQFASVLIKEKINTYQNFIYILYFGYYQQNHELITAVMETLDGWEMFPNLSQQLREQFGQDFHDDIFRGITLPPHGTHPKLKPPIIIELVARIIQRLGRERAKEFFKPGLRDKYPQSYVKGREMFEKTQDIDQVLLSKHQSLMDTLQQHYQEHSLFFTQPVTREVLKFVKENPQIGAGVRKDKTIYMTKIPYQTDLALKETETRRRNYYTCHNPLFREALLDDDCPIDPLFCNCSGGFIKNYWEEVLGEKVDVELLESVLTGGKFCRFAVHLSSEIVDTNQILP